MAWTVIETTDAERKYNTEDLYKVVNGDKQDGSYPTRQSAQFRADVLNDPDGDEDFFDGWIEENEKVETGTHQQEPVQTLPPAEEEAEFVGGNHKVGDEITDKDGNIYVAIQPSYYISGADAADMEDGWDAQVDVGWHSPARLKSQSTQVIVEQVQTGQAKIVRRNGKTCVLFHDENQTIPLDDLSYSNEIGLYQKSKFPNLQ